MAEVRRIRKADHGAVAAMRAKLWPESNKAHHLGELKRQVRDRKFRAWVALEDGKYAGFSEAYVRPYANGCEAMPVVFLEGIWVEPSWRKKGVGSSLVKAVEDWARERGDKEIGSDSLVENKVSWKVHQTWGFEEKERVVCYSKKLDPAS